MIVFFSRESHPHQRSFEIIMIIFMAILSLPRSMGMEKWKNTFWVARWGLKVKVLKRIRWICSLMMFKIWEGLKMIQSSVFQPCSVHDTLNKLKIFASHKIKFSWKFLEKSNFANNFGFLQIFVTHLEHLGWETLDFWILNRVKTFWSFQVSDW